MLRTETLILKNLIYNEDFCRKVFPYLREDYFRQSHEKTIFKYISEYTSKYTNRPSVEALEVKAENDSLVEDTYKEVVNALTEIKSIKDERSDQQWLVDQAEEFVKEKALANAAFSAVAILEGKDKKNDKGAIPDIFEKALAISFDPSVGQDYIEDAAARYERLHAEEFKVAFDIEECNKATKGGVSKKTLNVLAGGVYAGKTLGLCHLAASYLRSGKNVLYISLEIAEDLINMRIDCNLLNINIDDMDNIPKDIFMKKVEKVRSQTLGKLITKDYPAGSVHVNNFRALLHELKLKRNFVPHVIMVDYLNLCASSRVKASDKTHITIMAVAEELRALAHEVDVPIWTATQLDAEGINSSDPGMTNISGSKVGLAATCDLLWMLVVTESLKELGQIMIIQHKNRYKDASDRKKFYVGIDRKKFRWHDCDQKANATVESENDPLDPDQEDEDIKREVSKKYGQQAYESAYKTVQSAKFGTRGKTKFSDFQL